VIGAAASVAAISVPWVRARRGAELGAAALVAVVTLVAAQGYPAAMVALPLVGALLGAVGMRSGRRHTTGPLAVLGVGAGWIYLSVPDTEGAVLLAGVIAVSFVVEAYQREDGPARAVGLGLGALVGALATVLVQNRGEWTPAGWIVAKIAMVAALVGGWLVVRRLAAGRRDVTSAPGRPSP